MAALEHADLANVDGPLTQHALLSALAPVFADALRTLQAQRAAGLVIPQPLVREPLRDFLSEVLRAVSRSAFRG